MYPNIILMVKWRFKANVDLTLRQLFMPLSCKGSVKQVLTYCGRLIFLRATDIGYA